MPRYIKWSLVAAATVGVLIQFYRPELTNPPVDPSVTIQSKLHVPPEVDEILRRSCYDCHSHETRWPWYSAIAPSRWLLAKDVADGRQHMNFSQWTYNNLRSVGKLDQMVQEIDEGEMPLRSYLLMHPSKRLSEQEKNLIFDWVEKERERLLAAGEE
jgi:hypothetical protein